MPPKSKVPVTFTLEADQQEWLEKMAAAHDLPDVSKTLRVVLDYAMQDGDAQKIFAEIRCLRCG